MPPARADGNAPTAGPTGSAVALLAARLDAALPQTQCTRCGYPDCAAYATAMATGEAEINRCPPGGREGVERLAAIVGRSPLPLDAASGAEGPRRLAVIDEAWCIGCTLCLDACPTDAILGRSKRMHTVIEAHCTGCERCIPVCPVDCIALVPSDSGERTGWGAWSQVQANEALGRYRLHRARAITMPTAIDEEPAPEYVSAPPLAPNPPQTPPSEDSAADRRKAAIAAALARARERRG
ncbi:RnfABCDGE type electron transport complex subunit B [uncultured Xylophilus sp.]|uniref:RnfABCDGE type electron transport complex subunit B n=1 Tax=uncultured Xylophilus sp. TaxID=296832 RepID=UPI0025E7B62E|nr:RnfABCDGE type electron transport complex subunit B [uncultured Xylophilus sp.]